MTEKNKSKQDGPGRPFLPEKERRSVLMQFRVTEKEAAQIRSQAKRSSMSASDWLRQLAIEG